MVIGLIERLDGFADSVLIALFYHHDYTSLMSIGLVIALLKIIKKIFLFL